MIDSCACDWVCGSRSMSGSSSGSLLRRLGLWTVQSTTTITGIFWLNFQQWKKAQSIFFYSLWPQHTRHFISETAAICRVNSGWLRNFLPLRWLRKRVSINLNSPKTSTFACLLVCVSQIKQNMLLVPLSWLFHFEWVLKRARINVISLRRNVAAGKMFSNEPGFIGYTGVILWAIKFSLIFCIKYCNFQNFYWNKAGKPAYP